MTLASGSFRVLAGHTATAKLRLTLHGRQLLDRDRSMHVAVFVVSLDGSGTHHFARRLALLRAPLALRRA
jgi:hypothetical protein